MRWQKCSHLPALCWRGRATAEAAAPTPPKPAPPQIPVAGPPFEPVGVLRGGEDRAAPPLQRAFLTGLHVRRDLHLNGVRCHVRVVGAAIHVPERLELGYAEPAQMED